MKPLFLCREIFCTLPLCSCSILAVARYCLLRGHCPESYWDSCRRLRQNNTVLAARAELVSAFFHPETNLLFDGKTSRRVPVELRCQCEGMGLERYREVGMGPKEAANQKAHVPLQSEDLKLDSMHQCAK